MAVWLPNTFSIYDSAASSHPTKVRPAYFCLPSTGSMALQLPLPRVSMVVSMDVKASWQQQNQKLTS
jgi:hypothetical protein